jgi:hypothetical protein
MVAAALLSGQFYFSNIRDQSGATLSERHRISAYAATTNLSLLDQFTWVRPFIERLVQVASLPLNWAGPGSKPPNYQTLTTAAQLLASIAKPRTKPPNVAPMPDGGVNLTWYAGGVELEISIESNGTFAASVFNVAEGVEYDELELTNPVLVSAIERLTPTA